MRPLLPLGGTATQPAGLLAASAASLRPAARRACAAARGEAGALFHWHETEHHEELERAKAAAGGKGAEAADGKKKS